MTTTNYLLSMPFDLFQICKTFFYFISLAFLRLPYNNRVLLVSVILFRFAHFNGFLFVRCFRFGRIFFLWLVLMQILNYRLYLVDL